MKVSNLFAPRLKSLKNFGQLASYDTSRLLEDFSFTSDDGSYISSLPLRKKIQNKIESYIVRRLMELGFQELDIGIVQDPDLWKKSGRYENFVQHMYFAENSVLMPTTEEPVSSFMSRARLSYRDLPIYIFGIRELFRKATGNRAVRTSQFRLLDVYSFETDAGAVLKSEQDLFLPTVRDVMRETGLQYYEVQKNDTYRDFRVVTSSGDDPLYVSEDGTAFDQEPADIPTEEKKSLSVAVCMNFGTSYSENYGLRFADRDNTFRDVNVGSFAIGLDRLFFVMADQSKKTVRDSPAFQWPAGYASFELAILSVPGVDASRFYTDAARSGVDVLYDDTGDAIGIKKRRACAIGIPSVSVVGERELEKGDASVERTDTGDRIAFYKYVISHESDRR